MLRPVRKGAQSVLSTGMADKMFGLAIDDIERGFLEFHFH